MAAPIKTVSVPGLVQYRFPRSKKRRIRIKWAKRKVNYRHAIIQIPESVWLKLSKVYYIAI